MKHFKNVTKRNFITGNTRKRRERLVAGSYVYLERNWLSQSNKLSILRSVPTWTTSDFFREAVRGKTWPLC